jgi:hypothetical protein
MQARPSRSVKRGRKSNAGFDRCDESLLIGKHGFQPQLDEQHVPRREAVIERALWGFQPLRDGIDRDRAWAPFNARAAARKPALSKSARPIYLDYVV